MTMPLSLVLVRHGQSEGNVAVQASKDGDDTHYTEQFVSSPDSRWALTDLGKAQAACAGTYLRQLRFDKFYVSPYTRTRQTAAGLNLPDARWRLNRALRERDWGDIGTMPKSQYSSDPVLAINFRRQATDPLYWTPPNGESVADVAENRVRNVIRSLQERAADQNILAVTHGDAITAFRLVLERMSDEAFERMSRDKTQNIRNCEVIEYSRVNPRDTGKPTSDELCWRKRSRPLQRPDGTWVMDVGQWEHFTSSFLTNDDLLTEPS
jgi:broad specificity phosphatase PhoE